MSLALCLRIQPLTPSLATTGIKPGQKVGAALDRQMRWQLQYEGGASEDCLAHLRSAMVDL